MQPPFPSPTATWHNESYDAINPSNAGLSQAGKTVIITGAGSGIGRATALAFAKADAARLILIGRTESTLEETKKLLAESKSECAVYPVSATDETAMHDIAKQVGAWDVLVLAAAHISSPSKIVEASLQDWWADYETNVKSIVIASQAFIRSLLAQLLCRQHTHPDYRVTLYQRPRRQRSSSSLPLRTQISSHAPYILEWWIQVSSEALARIRHSYLWTLVSGNKK
jgi:NAD(P)-dependent dehydrogenase (short-subunit alcohol dehydrogenase family)